MPFLIFCSHDPAFEDDDRQQYPVIILLILFLLPPILPHRSTDVVGQEVQPPEHQNDARSHDQIEPADMEEKWNSGWAFYLDNDIVAERDGGDYTGGFAISLSGKRAKEWFFSLDPILGFLNDVTGFSSLDTGSRTLRRHSFEFGTTAFTPEDITREDPIFDDQPYAGLVFLNNVRRTTNLDDDITYLSSFTLGVLGTGIVPEIQEITHDITGSDDPMGWEHQISDGGEPTFKYTLLRQDLLYTQREGGFSDFDLKSTFGGSVGYITQVQGGISWRFGRLSTPAWKFSPDFGEYVNLGSPVDREVGDDPFPHELFLWGGLNARLRGYNAFLEGQFRDSTVTFDRSELHPLIGEANFGITCGFQTGTRVSIGVRARTEELNPARGNRTVWGTLMLSQAY